MTYEQLARIEYLEGQIDALEGQQDALEAQITKYLIVIEELQRKLQTAQSERHAAEQGVEELRAYPTTTEIWQQHADLRGENEKLLRERARLTEILDHVRADRDAARAELHDLKAERDAAQAERDAALTQRNAAEKRCDALKSAIEKRDQTLAELRKWLSTCEATRNAAVDERDRWRALYRDMGEKRDALAQRVTELHRWLHPSSSGDKRIILGPGEQVIVAVPFPDDRSADDQSSTGSESA